MRKIEMAGMGYNNEKGDEDGKRIRRENGPCDNRRS
jgi:hypothetical protein